MSSEFSVQDTIRLDIGGQVRQGFVRSFGSKHTQVCTYIGYPMQPVYCNAERVHYVMHVGVYACTDIGIGIGIDIDTDIDIDANSCS